MTEKNSFLRELMKTALVAFASCLVVGFVWDQLIVVFEVPGYLVPRPLEVLRVGFGDNGPLLLDRAYFTLISAFLGLLLSTIFAVAIAIGFILSPKAKQLSMPLIIAFRSAPVAAVAPIIMLMLGRGVATSVVVVLIVSFFPLLVNLSRGLQASSGNALELMHIYNASSWKTLRFVRIPSALPFFFTGLRISVTSSVLGAMLSEWITGSRGLGLLILESGAMRHIELLWAAVLVSIALALILFWLTSAGERKALIYGNPSAAAAGDGR